jgi:hypothetical protein
VLLPETSFVILSVDSGGAAGRLELEYAELKLHQDFSIRPHPYTLRLLISNPFCSDQNSIQAHY